MTAIAIEWVDAPSYQFGAVYLVLNIISLLMSLLARWLLIPSRTPLQAEGRLTPCHVAMLAGGPHRVVQSVLAGLAQREMIRPRGLEIGTSPTPIPRLTDWSEITVWDALISGSTTRRQLYASCGKPFRRVREDLENWQLVPTNNRQLLLRLVPAIVGCGPLIPALIRLVHRIHEHRRIDILAALCLYPIVAAVGHLAAETRTTTESKRTLASLRATNQRLQSLSGRVLASLSYTHCAMAVALFGFKCLQNGRLEWLYDFFNPATAVGSDGSGGNDGDGGHFGEGGGGSGSDPF